MCDSPLKKPELRVLSNPWQYFLRLWCPLWTCEACVMKLATHAKRAKTGGDGGGKPEEVL